MITLSKARRARRTLRAEGRARNQNEVMKITKLTVNVRIKTADELNTIFFVYVIELFAFNVAYMMNT